MFKPFGPGGTKPLLIPGSRQKKIALLSVLQLSGLKDNSGLIPFKAEGDSI